MTSKQEEIDDATRDVCYGDDTGSDVFGISAWMRIPHWISYQHADENYHNRSHLSQSVGH